MVCGVNIFPLYRLYSFNLLLLSAKYVAVEFILAEANILQCYKPPPVKAFIDDLFLKSKYVDAL